MSSVNNSNKPKRKQVIRENPLVPRNLVDTAQQRLVVIAFFVLIQSFKIYDLIILKSGNNQNKLESPQVINTLLFISFHDNKLNFLFKYLIIDTLFIWFLPFLNIPFLNFNRVVTLIQIAIVVFADMLLANEVSIPFASTIITVLAKLFNINQQEMTLLGDIVNRNDILDHSQYFKGKKTIKFLPDSSVELNPFNYNWCMDNDLIQVPIKFNTSSDSLDFLQLKYVSLEDNSVELLNYTSKNLKKMIKNGNKAYYNEMAGQDNIFYLDVLLPEAGYYLINQVIDNKAMNLRLLNKHLIIPQCPSAKLVATSPDLNQMCLNDNIKEDDLMINVVGLPPLTISYNEEINGVITNKLKRQVVPNNFKSPLQDAGAKLTSKDLNDLSSWASLRSINIPVLSNKQLDKAGEYVFVVTSVEDSLGNRILYEEQQPSIENGLLYKFATRNLPLGKLIDYSSSRPLLEGGSKKLNIQLGGIPCQKCDSPYTAKISHYDENNAFVKSFDQSFDLSTSRDLSFSVIEPGYYELDEFLSKYCSTGKSNRIHVPFVEKPHVSIVADSIVDTCVGTTGFTFRFNVTGGTPPFRLEYKVNRLKNGRLTSIPQIKAIEAKSRIFEHDYKPNIEGNYSIEFFKMKDQYYEEKFKQDQYKYVTYFKQRPRLNVKQDFYNVCHGNSQSVPITFEGKAPFSLKYNLVKNNEIVQTFEQTNIIENEYLINTPSFTSGGVYSIELIEAKDASHCNVELKKNRMSIAVRSDVPQLFFAKEQNTLIVEGSYQHIPMKVQNLNGKQIELTYSLKDSTGLESTHTIHNFNPNNGFRVEKQGTYTLKSFNDGGCPGVVASDQRVTVGYYPKPQIELTSTSSAPVCVNKNQGFSFKLTGKAPFSVAYSIQHPNKEVENIYGQADGNVFTLKAITSKSGDYKYSINGVHDKLYTGEIFDILERTGVYKFDKIEVNHKVWDTPTAIFSNSSTAKPVHSHQNKFIQMCSSNLNDDKLLEPLPIKLFGQPPFSLKLSIDSKNNNFHKNFRLSGIEKNYFESYDVYKIVKLDIGSYTVSLLEIEDGNGCVNTNLKEQSNNVILKINDVPKIKRHINKFAEHNKIDVLAFVKHKINKAQNYDDYYCVGDHIFFQLDGLLPYNVAYKFNNELHNINSLSIPNFKRLATNPGELQIESISDSSAKNCIVNLQELSEKIKIYDLPSVEIFQGNTIEEDIHEGDKAELSFTLKGVPPFKLTYTRTTIDDGYDTKRKRKGKKHGNKIIETEVVENIQGFEYSIWTSLEGTYEAVEVEDSRCRVQNYV